MRKIGEFFKFKEEDIEVLSKFASLRNRLAHRYLNFKWQVVKFYIEHADLLKQLPRQIYEYEEKIAKEG